MSLMAKGACARFGILKGLLRAFVVCALAACTSLVLVQIAYADDIVSTEDEPRVISAVSIPHVADAADILTSGEEARLEQRAMEIESQYGFGVYLVTVDDYRAFSEWDVFEAATVIYNGYNLGVGAERNGLMLLLSMNDRDYSLITYGDFGNYAFNDDGRIRMTEYFLDDFADDDWYAGFADYLDTAELYLEAAHDGEPYSEANMLITREDASETFLVYAIAVILLPLIITFIVIRIMDSKMKSVARATQASHYVVGDLQLTARIDNYSHTTETVVRVESDSGGGGPRTSHMGGFGGSSGKF